MSHGLILCLLVALQLPKPPSDEPPRPFEPGDRAHEIVRYDCKSDIGRREVTLFANGTVRVRDGEPGREATGLAELTVEELEGFVNRLEGIDLSREKPFRGVEGDWIERCTLVVELTGGERRELKFSRYDSLSLNIANVLTIVGDVAAKVTDLGHREELPVGYEPRVGDVLKRWDGQPYRIRGFTADKKGIELQGVKSPLTLYIPRDQLRREFIAVVPPKKWPS
jgi:hypothetical protein